MKRKIKQWYARNFDRPDFSGKVRELRELTGITGTEPREKIYGKIDALSLSDSLKAYKITGKK